MMMNITYVSKRYRVYGVFSTVNITHYPRISKLQLYRCNKNGNTKLMTPNAPGFYSQ
jgi:hypothetical protein